MLKKGCHMNVKFILFLGLATAAGTLPAQKILFSPEKQMGIRAPELSENRWNSQIMDISRRYGEQELTALDADFFTGEYGMPFLFRDDLPKRFGLRTSGAYTIRNNALEVRVPAKGWSILFGAKRGERTIPSIRFGRGWGKFSEYRYRLELLLEQDVPETEWQFFRHTPYGKSGKKFKAPGKERQLLKVNLGLIGNNPYMIGGLELQCSTPDARIRIHSMRIVPYVLNISWRRKFRLDFDPVRGGISLYPRCNFDLFVNGEKAASGNHLLGGGHGVLRIDISKLLRKGDNEIVYRGNFNGGYGPTQRLLQESFAIGKNGEQLHLPGDTNWEWSFDGKNWHKPVLRGAIGEERQPNGNRIAEGSIPLHAGPLDIRHPGQPYPVFDYDGAIAYEVSIPSGIPSPELRLTVRHPLTGKELETCSVSRSRTGGDFRIFSVTPELREVGAYRMEWELRSSGTVIDRTRTEMIICGPLKQDAVAFKDFETELSKRLEPIQKIDCTQEYGPTEFLDHSSHYSAAKLNLSRITARNGMKYRETGESSSDYFAYKLKIRNPGAAHIAEVIIPDNAERILYSTVNETFPLNFCNNNFPVGSRGWPNASGSVMTGGLHPLSFRTKVMRYVFFPGSRNITITLENGKTGTRAAVCAVNIYEVRGGLPALKLPETGRLYANHNERFLFHNWGAFVYPKIQEGTQDYFESFWSAAYYGIANRIAYLKFAGHNASVEGSYMYSQGFPTASGHSTSHWTDFDYYYAMLKMYKHNGIRTFVGFEYMRSPKLNLDNRYDVGDREVQAGTARSIHNVDRYGKQTIGYQGMGLNYLNPHVWNSITELLGEIYRKYEGIGGIEGLFIINGFWWLPGLTTPPGQTAEEIGYDDDSIEAFESDTGIRLNLPVRGRERFEKRYALLNGPHYNAWYAWRSRKMREKTEELAAVIRSGKNKWKLFTVPNVSYPDEHPFNRMNATAKERDTFQETYLKRAAFDPALYNGKDGITLVPKLDYDRQLTMPRYGSITNRGTRKLYERNNAVYLAPVGLNERKVKATAAGEWWWRNTGICVYDVKPAGEFAFADLVDVISGFTPKYMFHTWLDVNCTTAHTGEARRLLAAFYATPERQFEPFSGIRGIQAKTADDHVQLVNDTPYPVSGVLTAGTKAEDKVTGNTFTGTVRYEVRPFGIAVIRIDDPVRNLSGTLSFDSETAKLLRTQAETILNTRQLRMKIQPDFLSALRQALTAKNDYRLCTLMRNFEVLHTAKRFFDSAPYQKNQNRLLQLLEKENTVRINCGASTDYTDGDGKLWLPDQPYTGFNAYGSEFTSSVHRGAIAIANTKAPEVYRNEANGSRIYYHIPLPPGEYRVKLHVAETWDKHPGRAMSVTVAGQQKTVRPWETAGGRCAAAVVTWDSVSVRDGLLSIELTQNPIINGIEIERKNNMKTACLAAALLTSAALPAGTIADLKPESGMNINWNKQKFGEQTISGNKIKVKQEGKHTIFTLGPESNLAVSSIKTDKPANRERTISMLIRTSGRKGFLQFSENIYRYDIIVNDGKAKAEITFFPPGKQWFSVYYPQKQFFENGKWHHIAITVNPRGDGAIFIDGELKVQKPLKRLHDVEIPAGKMGITAALWGKKAHSEDFRADIARIVYRDELLSTPAIRKEADEWLASVE